MLPQEQVLEIPVQEDIPAHVAEEAIIETVHLDKS